MWLELPEKEDKQPDPISCLVDLILSVPLALLVVYFFQFTSFFATVLVISAISWASLVGENRYNQRLLLAILCGVCGVLPVYGLFAFVKMPVIAGVICMMQVAPREFKEVSSTYELFYRGMGLGLACILSVVCAFIYLYLDFAGHQVRSLLFMNTPLEMLTSLGACIFSGVWMVSFNLYRFVAMKRIFIS